MTQCLKPQQHGAHSQSLAFQPKQSMISNREINDQMRQETTKYDHFFTHKQQEKDVRENNQTYIDFRSKEITINWS